MSTIRYFDDVPHIVRYGMQDDKKEISWVLFWRNGSGFRIHVDHDDVRDTTFSKTWLEYLKEPTVSADGSASRDWIQRWDSLCDCIISPCLPLLKEIAPSSRQWVTLDDYIHTPTYQLKLVTDPATKEVIPAITEGPKDKPAYEIWPTAAANIKELPTDGRQYHARDLVVLDKEENWRRPPHKVQSPDGQVFVFKACQETSKHMPDGKFTNKSIDSINAQCRRFDGAAAKFHIQQLAGVVVTEPSPDTEDSRPSANWKEDPEAGAESQQRQDTRLVAGILLTFIANSQSLAKLLKSEQDKPTAEQKAGWKEQITEALEHMHARRTTIGGHGAGAETWYYLNQHTVEIGEGGAWLTLGAGCTFHDAGAQDTFEQERAMDMKGLEKTFDF